METGTLTLPIATVRFRRSSDLDPDGPPGAALGRGRRGVCLGVRPPFSNATLPRVRTALTTSRPQNCGAVCRRACNQIERKTIPNYCKLFNEFSRYALQLTRDAERAGERKLTRLRRRFRHDARSW